MSVCVQPAHRAAHTVRTLAHIRRADALPRSRCIDDRCRLEEPLQIERDIIAARAQAAAQGRIFTEESADAAELRLFKEDELIDVRISLKQRIGGRLDHPRQMCIGIGLLDGIGNGQRMNHIADRTEFDDQDILHGLPSFLSPYFRAHAACSPAVSAVRFPERILTGTYAANTTRDYPRPAFSIIPVVDFPATSGIKATSPPYASTMRASGSVSRV